MAGVLVVVLVVVVMMVVVAAEAWPSDATNQVSRVREVATSAVDAVGAGAEAAAEAQSCERSYYGQRC